MQAGERFVTAILAIILVNLRYFLLPLPWSRILKIAGGPASLLSYD
jgi:hypothetical protein